MTDRQFSAARKSFAASSPPELTRLRYARPVNPISRRRNALLFVRLAERNAHVVLSTLLMILALAGRWLVKASRAPVL